MLKAKRNQHYIKNVRLQILLLTSRINPNAKSVYMPNLKSFATNITIQYISQIFSSTQNYIFSFTQNYKNFVYFFLLKQVNAFWLQLKNWKSHLDFTYYGDYYGLLFYARELTTALILSHSDEDSILKKLFSMLMATDVTIIQPRKPDTWSLKIPVEVLI